MWCGMLWSRALLSISLVAFVTAAIVAAGPVQSWRTFRREPSAWGLALLFLIPLVTLPWTQDKAAWMNLMQVKLPFLFLPFTIAGLASMPPSAVRWAWRGMLVATLLASLMVLWEYAGAVRDVNASYLRGGVMQVSMDNDHVRFGWALAILYVVVLEGVLNRDHDLLGWGRTTGVALLVFLGAFILVLASRTGLLGLLLAHGYALFSMPPGRWRRKARSLMLALPLAALYFMPSLANRVRFMVWDFQNYSRGGYVKGLNDAPRVISWQAGIDLMKQAPWTGTGSGDLDAAMKEWYAMHRPDMPEKEQLHPSNEWILHGAAAGIAGLIAFTCAIFIIVRSRSTWMVWRVTMALSILGFLYELGIEMQYGVYLFGFFTVFFLSRDPTRKDHSFTFDAIDRKEQQP